MRLKLIGVIGDVLQHRTEILQIEQKQAAFIGNLEDHVQHTLLRIVEIEQSSKQQRAHFRNRRANGMSVLAEHIPKNDRTGFAVEIVDSQDPSRVGRLWDYLPPIWLSRRDRLLRRP